MKPNEVLKACHATINTYLAYYLTVVDRLIFGWPSTFFTKFVYEFHFQCRMPGSDQKVDYSTLN